MSKHNTLLRIYAKKESDIIDQSTRLEHIASFSIKAKRVSLVEFKYIFFVFYIVVFFFYLLLLVLILTFLLFLLIFLFFVPTFQCVPTCVYHIVHRIPVQPWITNINSLKSKYEPNQYSLPVYILFSRCLFTSICKYIFTFVVLKVFPKIQPWPKSDVGWGLQTEYHKERNMLVSYIL